jgi:hypothetical protein
VQDRWDGVLRDRVAVRREAAFEDDGIASVFGAVAIAVAEVKFSGRRGGVVCRPYFEAEFCGEVGEGVKGGEVWRKRGRLDSGLFCGVREVTQAGVKAGRQGAGWQFHED